MTFITKDSFKKKAAFIAGIFLIITFLRLPYAIIPFFNNDEAIYAAAADSILHGGIMYKDAADPCAPITPYLYAGIFKLFGSNNMFAVHVASVFLIAGIAVILFMIGSLFDKKTGYLAALFFAVYSFTYEPLDVLAFNTEWLAAFFCSLGAFFLLKSLLINRQYFLLLSGVFFGLGFFSKQVVLLHFLSAVIFCFFYYYRKGGKLNVMIKPALTLLAGFILVTVSFIFFFFQNKALKEFWFWFWEYHNKFYVPQIFFMDRARYAFLYLLAPGSFLARNFFLPVTFILGSIITFVNMSCGKEKFKNELYADFYLVIWGFFAYLGAIYSGRSFGHYFILILPAFCILADRTVGFLFNRIKKKIIKIFLVIVIFMSVFFSFIQYFNYNFTLRLWKTFFAKEKPLLISPELHELILFIKNNSQESDLIFVWGFYPEVYVLSNRLSASRYQNCNFLTGLIPWTNTGAGIDTKETIIPGSWEIFINDLNNNLPLYIIDTSLGDINCYGKYPPGKFKELADLLDENYSVEKDFFSAKDLPVFRLYKRKDG